MPELLFNRGSNASIELDFVSVGHGLSVMRNEVTESEWGACVADDGCHFQPTSKTARQGGPYPVTGVGVLDAQEFVLWAQNTIDPHVRLPTLEEWYTFSELRPVRPKTVFTDPRLAWAATYGTDGAIDPRLRTSGGFGANSKGLEDIKGNVWEWTSTCAANTSPQRCPAFYAAGEHETRVPIFVRDPSSGGCATGTPPAHLGIRLVRDNEGNN